MTIMNCYFSNKYFSFIIINMRQFLSDIRFENRKRKFLVEVKLLLGDLFHANSHKAIKWQDINSLLDGSVLEIIISIIGTCDGKISRVKVSETLKKSPKTRIFELHFTSFINLRGKASNRCRSCVVILVCSLKFNLRSLRFADW